MNSNEFINRFFEVCSGISLILFSLGFFFFSLNYNSLKAAPGATKTPAEKAYQPVGISVNQNGQVTVYGYNSSGNTLMPKIIILASERPQ